MAGEGRLGRSRARTVERTPLSSGGDVDHAGVDPLPIGQVGSMFDTRLNFVPGAGPVLETPLELDWFMTANQGAGHGDKPKADPRLYREGLGPDTVHSKRLGRQSACQRSCQQNSTGWPRLGGLEQTKAAVAPDLTRPDFNRRDRANEP